MTSLSIATWNVNSIRTRLPQALSWLREAAPDIVCLQELKCVEDQFPAMEIEELGYNLALFGQKSYNGVAILSKYPLEDITRGLPGEPEDEAARYIEAVVSVGDKALRVASIYVPNGQAVDSDKFQYKMRFYDRLRAHADKLLQLDEMLVLAADYNVAPFPIDVYDPKRLDGTVCYHPLERDKLRTLFYDGLHDAYRLSNPTKQEYSWWDYRTRDFEQNHGLRIDHLLLSAQAADRLVSCDIAVALRGQEKASDHVPVVGKFNLA